MELNKMADTSDIPRLRWNISTQRLHKVARTLFLGRVTYGSNDSKQGDDFGSITKVEDAMS